MLIRAIEVHGLNALSSTLFNPSVTPTFAFNIEDDPEQYLFWDENLIPPYYGVYAIYDYFGVCLYVGESDNIYTRIKQHYSNKKTNGKDKMEYEDFRPFAHYVKTYRIEDTLDRLLFERVLIKSLNPPFNRDDHDTKSYTYLYRSKYLSDIDIWLTYGDEIGTLDIYKPLFQHGYDSRLSLFHALKNIHSPTEKFKLIDYWEEVYNEVHKNIPPKYKYPQTP